MERIAAWRTAAACALLLAGAPPRTRLSAQGSGTTRDYRYLMGTSVEVEASGDASTRRAAVDEAFGAMAEVDRLMSNYRDDSELSRINHRAAQEPVMVSDPMLSVLTAAQRVSLSSGGAFDITVGPIVRLWGFHDKQPHLPTSTELTTVRASVDYRNLLINVDAHSVRFGRPGVELDLGGIAKGFAVEVAGNSLRRRGLSGFIDAGGNQYLVGTPVGKRNWTIGIKDPDHADGLLGAIETAETSVSTSADYATFVEINGRRYGHVIDPHTLQPSEASLSATIIARDATIADALSKAAFVLGPSAGLRLVDSFPGAAAIIAHRRSDGSIGIAISERLKSAFHPVVRTPRLDHR
jgi:thiamine biosynthesis lipoprotein